MKATITNHDLQPAWWNRNFTRTALRKLARAHDIWRGRNAGDTARNLTSGFRGSAPVVTFTMTVEIPELPPSCAEIRPSEDWRP